MNSAEEDLEVIITVRSIKHDCHTAYVLSRLQIDNGLTEAVIRDMMHRLQEFIRENENAASEGKESEDA